MVKLKYHLVTMTQAEVEQSLKTLKNRYESVKTNLDLETKKAELKTLQSQMESPDFWNDQTTAQKISQNASTLEKFITLWESIAQNITDLADLLSITSETEIAEITQEIKSLETTFDEAETLLILGGAYDQNNVILSLHVGNGGQDAEDFCQILQRMYLRFAESKGWKTRVLEESNSEAGIKSAMIEIKGALAYGLLKSEHGVHRLIRLSPFNAKSLRQTSFARVEILPEVEDESELMIEEKDIRIDVFRSSGAGGQSVNTTDSAVRITYLPLNLVVTCQNEKSQHQNKEAALKVLRSRLTQLKLEQKAEALQKLRGDLMENAFGSQIRTYTLQPYKLVKDHRTDYEEANPDKVFDGEIEAFIQAFLRQ